MLASLPMVALLTALPLAASVALGVTLLVLGLLAAAIGMPALVVLVLWRRTRALRERGVERGAGFLAEHHRPGAIRTAQLLLGIADLTVRRRLLPWLALVVAGAVAVGVGSALLAGV